jgi:precorrin-6B C5,15-methyltransferase / cobalt-precorrin-6B C5,C15-methyltransferase
VNKIHVIGVGYRPFTQAARQVLSMADHIIASNRLFEVFSRYEDFSSLKEKLMVINGIDETMEFIRNNFEERAIVLLASGDPLFFGIGRKVIGEFGENRVEILPDLSSIQLAFAKIKKPWDDVFLMSLHGGPDLEKRRRLPYEISDIPSLIRAHDKIAVLTDKENNPSAIANYLNFPAGPYSSLLIYVCEKLGYPDEKITAGTPEKIAGMVFSNPNVVILVNSEEEREKWSTDGRKSPDNTEPPFGLSEGEITHSRGLITKDEVRAVSIHKLRLPKEGILWDIGAGSGSVSIEAARLYPGLNVFAIEKNEQQLRDIKENKIKFGIPNIAVTSGEAPEALKELTSPDRVFIGGSGGRLSEIVRLIRERMPRGVVVLNAVTLETLNKALQVLEDSGFQTEISQVSVSRSKLLNGQRQMAALNPVFIVRGERK